MSAPHCPLPPNEALAQFGMAGIIITVDTVVCRMKWTFSGWPPHQYVWPPHWPPNTQVLEPPLACTRNGINKTDICDFITRTLLRYAVALYPSVVCLSVTFVRPTQMVEIFGSVSTPFCTLTIR